MFVIRTLMLVLLTGLPMAALASPCGEWFFQLQQAFARAGIDDAQARTVPGYPHLGINRWLAFLKNEAHSDAQQQQWLRLSAAKAWQDQQLLLQRLPPARRPPADQPADTLLAQCLPALAADTDFAALPAVTVPDSYSRWQRVLGLYPLTAWLASGSIQAYHDDMSARFQAPVAAPTRLYSPAPASGPLPAPDSLANNPLRLPLPDAAQTRALLQHYAPVLAVADSQRWNQPGQIRMGHDSPQVAPPATAYYWLSWTRFRGQNLLQLNYEFWFSQRPKRGALDLYGGKLDGLIWRVTLRGDGRVLFYDSIHPCGCYNKVYPVDPGLREADMDGDRPVFYPQPVTDAATQRVMVQLQPDVHYVVRVAPLAEGLPVQRYGLRPADSLRAIQRPDGTVASLFNDKGLVPASRRSERFTLWPLGVPSAGTMRQPGSHATAFKGKRHFDDPRLPDTLFRPAAP